MLIWLAVYKKKATLCAFFLLLASILAGCSRASAPPIPENNRMATGVAIGAAAGGTIASFSGVITAPAGAMIGGIAGGAIADYLAKRDDLFTDLDRGRMQIFKVGQEYMIVLPADAYFFQNSTHVNEAFYRSLDSVAEYIQKYETEVIKVAGYTDNVGNPTRNVALSRQQAQNILNYLWNKGLDTRMMYSIGYGEQFPVADNGSSDGRDANRRVQITFREIPQKPV